MGRLFKYMGTYWRTVLAVFAVLIAQAYCDLSLPAYTSNIVNVGIQQGGIEEKIPNAVTVDQMHRLLFFMVGTAEKQEVIDAYELDTDAYGKEAYVLKEEIRRNEEEIDRLYDRIKTAMILSMGLDAELGKMDGETRMEGNPVDQNTNSEIKPEQLQEQIAQMPDSIVEQAGTAYIRTAYKELGIDMDQLQLRYLFKVGGKMMALALLGMCASVLVGLLASRVGASAGRDLRSRVFHKVVGFSSNEFDHFSTASLITRSTNDIQQIQMLMVMLLRIVLYAPILAVGGIYQVFQTNVSMSWIIALAVVLIGGVVLVLFTVAMPKFKIMQKLVDRLNLVTREILTGLSVIRAFTTQKYEEERFDKANRDLTRTSLFVNRAMTFMMPVMMVIMNGISVLIVWTGARGISEGQMQVGDMMAFIQYTMQIIMSFLMICMISIMLPRAAVAAERVDEILTSETVIHDAKKPERLPKQLEGVVKFDHVFFRYPGASEEVLCDISFEARPGETTAIIGSTGSGKSTLVNLIPRFYDVTAGQITLDGKDIRELTQHDLRSCLGYVPQKGVLFSGNIASNILFGNSDGTKEEMMEAAQIAQASEFIETKPEQYESTIAQGGSNVSGGQKQRLSIARALAKHPKILIFDDSFSALDYKTDMALRRALREKVSDSTVIIVAQRISTILHANQIIVLDEGSVAGIGTHEELLENCEIYRQIAASQLSEEELTANRRGKVVSVHE